MLYADNILLVAPSVTSLQQLLNICEQELERLDMSLYVMQGLGRFSCAWNVPYVTPHNFEVDYPP